MRYTDIVKEIRKRTGYSQHQLAQAINVSFATVNRWENGHCEPAPIAVDGLRNFCRQQGLNYDEFRAIFIRSVQRTSFCTMVLKVALME